MRMGTSSDLLVGQRVYAIGGFPWVPIFDFTPFGLCLLKCVPGPVLCREPLWFGPHADQRHHLRDRWTAKCVHCAVPCSALPRRAELFCNTAVGREISSGVTGRPIENVIQTDAAINPGTFCLLCAYGMGGFGGLHICQGSIENCIVLWTQVTQEGRYLTPAGLLLVSVTTGSTRPSTAFAHLSTCMATGRHECQ